MTKPKHKRSRSYIENLLAEIKRKPSPTCSDPRQLTLNGAIRDQAFAKLDGVIKRTLTPKKGDQ